MWIMFIVLILCSVIVTWLSILTLNKGYGYKQTVDPLPTNNDKGNKEPNNKEG